MTIGIDMDDTIVNTSESLKEICKIYYPDYVDDVRSHKEVYKELLSKYGEYIHSTSSLKEHVKETIDYLHDSGYKIYFITMRNDYDVTKDYLVKHNIYFDKLILTGLEKGSIAKENNVDLFIDDKKIVIDEMIKNNIKYIKMHKESEDETGYFVLNNWYEIEDFFKSGGIKK